MSAIPPGAGSAASQENQKHNFHPTYEFAHIIIHHSVLMAFYFGLGVGF